MWNSHHFDDILFAKLCNMNPPLPQMLSLLFLSAIVAVVAGAPDAAPDFPVHFGSSAPSYGSHPPSYHPPPVQYHTPEPCYPRTVYKTEYQTRVQKVRPKRYRHVYNFLNEVVLKVFLSCIKNSVTSITRILHFLQFSQVVVCHKTAF